MATVSIVGPSAARKAERTAEALIARARMIFAERGLPDFTATHIEALGAEASYGARSTRPRVPGGAAAARRRTRRPRALEIFAREIGSIGLSFAPGTTGIYSGRPKPTPVVRLFTFFLDKTDCRPTQAAGRRSSESSRSRYRLTVVTFAPAPAASCRPDVIPSETTVDLPLSRLAYARSGDKGNSSNVAIIARRPEYLPLLRREVTPERIVAHLGHLVGGPAERFEAPGLNALNFLISDALGGGGMASRRIDPQGKAYGQMALEMTIPVPRSWAEAIE